MIGAASLVQSLLRQRMRVSPWPAFIRRASAAFPWHRACMYYGAFTKATLRPFAAAHTHVEGASSMAQPIHANADETSHQPDDAITMLTADHRQVRALFQQYAGT